MNPRLLIVLLPTLLFYSPLAAQFKYQANIEPGFYRSSGDLLSKESGPFFSIEGKLGYGIKSNITEAAINIKARPEFFINGESLFSFKIRGDFEFARNEESFDWFVNIARHFNHITREELKLNYDVFSFQASALFYWFEEIPISISAGYAYQDISAAGRQKHDIIFAEAAANLSSESGINHRYGFYTEKFYIERQQASSSGIRAGPQAEINYIGKFLINGKYRLLFHLQGETKFPSHEHWVRLVTGKFISENLSAFLMIDYFIRELHEGGGVAAFYSPFNRENDVSLKLAYEISERMEIYFKGGYFRNDLIYNKFSFEGWNFLLGLEFSN